MADLLLGGASYRARPNSPSHQPVMDGRLVDRRAGTAPGSWTALTWPSLAGGSTLGSPSVRPEGALLRIKTNTGERVAVAVLRSDETAPSGTTAGGHVIEALDVYDIGVFPGQVVYWRAA
jgi:hypothetical protein